MRFLVVFSIIMLGFTASWAQDTLVTRSNERIVCKIKEIGTDEIKYLLPGSDIVVVVDINEVTRIITASGTVMNFTDSMKDLKPFEKQKKNLIKVGIMSPLMGYTPIIYERSLKRPDEF